jgi:hypothetical protein
MAEETKVATPLSRAEDRVALILNGGAAGLDAHLALTELEKLVMLKMLRLEYPHQSTTLRELDAAIFREIGKLAANT